MPDGRPHRVPGGTYVFPVNLRDQSSRLLIDEIDTLRAVVRTVRARAPFHIDTWVVLPEHLHCIRTLPPDDDDYSARWPALKASFARAMPPTEWRSATRLGKGEPGIWHRRFREHAIRDDRDYAAHMDDVHFNPAKHLLVARAADWPYSSFGRCAEHGLYPVDRAMRVADRADAGECR